MGSSSNNVCNSVLSRGDFQKPGTFRFWCHPDRQEGIHSLRFSPDGLYFAFLAKSRRVGTVQTMQHQPQKGRVGQVRPKMISKSSRLENHLGYWPLFSGQSSVQSSLVWWHHVPPQGLNKFFGQAANGAARPGPHWIGF